MSLEKLIEGFQTFRASYFEDSNIYDDLVKLGQSPEVLIIGCSDSRSDPATLTQSKPGDIFVVRNVAAIVPPYQPDGHYHGTSAAIEFAVRGLKVKHIVVLGHALCGGCKALADNSTGKEFEFLAQWISIGKEAKQTVERVIPDAPEHVKHKALEQAMVLTSLNNLMTFPNIRAGVEANTLTLHGWYFDLVNGKLLSYDKARGTFADIGTGAGLKL